MRVVAAGDGGEGAAWGVGVRGTDAADDRPGATPEVVVIDACHRQRRGGSPSAVLDEVSFTDEER